MQQILPPPCQQGGGDAASADSGADASVRPAGRPARTRLLGLEDGSGIYVASALCVASRLCLYKLAVDEGLELIITVAKIVWPSLTNILRTVPKCHRSTTLRTTTQLLVNVKYV